MGKINAFIYALIIVIFVIMIRIFYGKTEKKFEKEETEKYLKKIEEEEKKEKVMEVNLEKRRLKVEGLVIEKLNASPDKVLVESVNGSIKQYVNRTTEEYKAYYEGDIYTVIIEKEEIIKFVKVFKRM